MTFGKKSAASLLPVLLSATTAVGTASAYFAQVANAHVEFVSSASASAAGAVDVDSSTPIINSSLLTTLEDALLARKQKSGEHPSLLGSSAPRIMALFEEWIQKFDVEYDSLEEKGRRMLVWFENHVLIEMHNNNNNNQKSSSFTLGHNEYSDMTHDEFRERMRLGEFSPGLVLREGDEKKFNFMDFEEKKKEKEEEIEEQEEKGGGNSNNNLRGATSDVSISAVADVDYAAVERRRIQEEVTNEDNAEELGTDWHAKGLMGPIRNQGTCGACWAFSAIGSIESAMAIDKYHKMTPGERSQLEQQTSKEMAANVVGSTSDLGLVVPLSEQNLIDCDVMYEKGCDGGLMTTTFEEEEHKKGICTEADYPYLQTGGTCSSNMCTPVPGSIVKNHVDVIPRKNAALVSALKVKPVTAAMVATDPMFQFYRSGVYSAEGCGRVTKKMGDTGCNVMYEGQEVCLPDINHGVLVVGYGTDDTITTEGEGSKTYFKVKNSWGEAWGEDGYFRIARYEEDKTDPMDNWGECAILTLLSYPVME